MEPLPANRATLAQRLRRQEAVVGLCQRAPETVDLSALLAEASVAVADTRTCRYAAVLDLASDGEALALRQGAGWDEDPADHAMVETAPDAPVGPALRADEPVVVDDRSTEGHPVRSELPLEHDLVGGIAVVNGSVEDPWGVPGTNTTHHRGFGDHDAAFLWRVSTLLASAIEDLEIRINEEIPVKDRFSHSPSVFGD